MENFDVSKQTEKLHVALDMAMKGFRTDSQVLIDILVVATETQRKAVCHNYKSLYGQDLGDAISQATNGNYTKLTCGLLKSSGEIDALCLKEAMQGFSTDYGSIISIICTSTNEEIRDMKNTYIQKYGITLEEDIRKRTSGDLEVLLVSLLHGGRSEKTEVNAEKANIDASELHDAINSIFGVDKSLFTSVFVNRSPAQLRATLDEFTRLTKKSILEDITANISSDLGRAFRSIGLWICEPNAYFSELMYTSMKGWGTKDTTLIRGVLKNYNTTNMDKILQTYLKDYGETMESWIKDDTSGTYRDTLVALINKAPDVVEKPVEPAETQEQTETAPEEAPVS